MCCEPKRMIHLKMGPLGVDPRRLVVWDNSRELMLIELSELGFRTRDPVVMSAALQVYASDAAYEMTIASDDQRVSYVFTRRHAAGFVMMCARDALNKKKKRKRLQML